MAVVASFFWQWAHLATFDLRFARVKKEIKLRLKAGVPDEERVHFTFTAPEFAQLHWVKPDREFRWNGRYYDVIERRADTSGRVHVACIDDHQETALFTALDDMVSRTMDDRSQGRSAAFKTISVWLAGLPCVWPRPQALPELTFDQRDPEVLRARSGFLSIVDPPPRS